MNTRKTVAALAAALFVALAFSACPSPGGDEVTPPFVPPPFMEMVKIPGGTFQMGSPETEVGSYNAEWPQRSITLNPFSMGKHEVTQKQYMTVMGSLPSWINATNYENWGKGNNFPVYGIRWFEAIIFCNKLSIMEGLTPAYTILGATNPDNWGTIPPTTTSQSFDDWDDVTCDSNASGYRLPTEEQWEYACRAGTTGPFNFSNGTGWGTSQITTNQANFDGTDETYDLYNNSPMGIYRDRATPVGAFAPNKWGLYNMHGNVKEWCWDRFYYNSRALRGGAWDEGGEYLRSASRNSALSAGTNLYQTGFRVARP